MGGVVVVNQLTAEIVNSDGYTSVMRDGYAIPAPASTVSVSGKDGSNVARTLRTLTDGTLRIDPTGATTQPVSGTLTANQGGTWNINDISGTITLPSGASTSAKQPALGTAGTASTDVITIQGISGMTAIKVDGSGFVQPVSQSGTWNVGTLTSITNVVHVDDNASSLTVDNAGTFAVQAAQSGTWITRIQDGYGINVTASSTTPIGTETALITRNIPSGTQTISGTVTVTQGTGTNLHTVVDSGTITTITNVVHIDDNSGSITVDGTVTANAGTGVFDVTPAVPAANDYLPVRLTDGSAFYNASGGGGSSSTKLINNDGYRLETNDGYAFTANNSALLVAGFNHGTNKVQIINVDATGAIKVDGSSFTQPVSGTVALGAGSQVIGHIIADSGSTTAVTGNVTVVQGTGTNLHTVIDSGTITTVSTLTSITNVVHVDDNSGSLTVDNNGTFVVQNQDGYGVKLTAQTGTPNATDTGLVVRNIPSGNQTVTQTTGTNLHMVVDSGTITTITNVVHIDDNASSITVDNGGTFAVQSAQSGTWNIRNQDGYGVLLTASSTTPVGTETALITRNIPSGTQTVTGTVALSAGAAVIGHVIADTGSTTAVTGNVTVVQGTGTNLHTVIDSGTLTTLSTLTTITNVVHVDDNAGSLTVDNGGTFAVQAAQSGTWNIGTVTTLTGITNALPSGSNVIGHVIIDSGSTTAVTGTVTVTGAKTSNNAAPGATNVGTLPAVANAAAPSFVEGNQVALSTDLGGSLRVSGSFSASTAATSTAADPTYVEGSTTSALSQTLTGQLRVLPAALVSDAPESYIDGTYKPLSVNAEGRLRVAMVPATTYMDFFGTDFNTAKTEDFTTLWDMSDSPWGPLIR